MGVNPTKLIESLITQAPALAVPGPYPSGGPYSGWRLFRDVEPDNAGKSDPTIPDTVVTLYGAPGGKGNPRYLLDYPAVQVRVRSSKNGYDAAYNQINALRSRLLGTFATTVLGDLVVSITIGSDVFCMGLDAQNRQRYVMTLNLITQPAQSSLDNRIPLPA